MKRIMETVIGPRGIFEIDKTPTKRTEFEEILENGKHHDNPNYQKYWDFVIMAAHGQQPMYVNHEYSFDRYGDSKIERAHDAMKNKNPYIRVGDTYAVPTTDGMRFETWIKELSDMRDSLEWAILQAIPDPEKFAEHMQIMHRLKDNIDSLQTANLSIYLTSYLDYGEGSFFPAKTSQDLPEVLVLSCWNWWAGMKYDALFRALYPNMNRVSLELVDPPFEVVGEDGIRRMTNRIVNCKGTGLPLPHRENVVQMDVENYLIGKFYRNYTIYNQGGN